MARGGAAGGHPRRMNAHSKEEYLNDAEMIKHLWTHKTQDHPVSADEELLIERGEGVYVWTRKREEAARRVRRARRWCNVGHGRTEIADAIREQSAKLSYYPDVAPVLEPPGRGACGEACRITPGDLGYTLFAVSGAEANERSMQIARTTGCASGGRKNTR